ncbi:MAG: CPBP family intramembrane metalloprotease [Saprospiraceae bacterium]|nr:CPBP family intramembrane metalloprotease [Saprospiraceae bacterium]
MNKPKALFALLLFLLGLAGVASILTMDIPLPPEAEAILKARYSPEEIKLLLLLNPTIMLLIAVAVGVSLYEKVQFRVPALERLSGVTQTPPDWKDLLLYGALGGVLAGILLSLIGLVFKPVLPAEFTELSEKLQPSLAARFLYGGMTEEIMMRFGFMTLVVWLCSKVFKGLRPVVYWTGIIVAAIVFALGHFPIAFQSVANPSPAFLAYILIGNSVGGIIFGWLYWKKGLESAFLAHLLAHVVMVAAGG